MKNRIPTQILENGAIRYAEYDSSGNFVQYRYLLPADEPTEEGTPLNKGSLCDDTTAALFGLGTAAVPNDIFQQLAEPAGTIKTSVRTDLGDNWLLCNGGIVSESVYPDLYAQLKSNTLTGTFKSASFSYKVLASAYLNGKFVVVCVDSTTGSMRLIAYYSDSAYGPWSSTVIYSASTIYYTGRARIRYINCKYILLLGEGQAGSSVYIYHTSDLSGTWTRKSLSAGKYAGDIKYGNGYYVVAAYGYSSSQNYPYILYSTTLDGTWENVLLSTSSTANLTFLNFENGVFYTAYQESSTTIAVVSFTVPTARTVTNTTVTSGYGLSDICLCDGVYVMLLTSTSAFLIYSSASLTGSFSLVNSQSKGTSSLNGVNKLLFDGTTYGVCSAQGTTIKIWCSSTLTGSFSTINTIVTGQTSNGLICYPAEDNGSFSIPITTYAYFRVKGQLPTISEDGYFGYIKASLGGD